MNQSIKLLKTPARAAGIVFATALLAAAAPLPARPGTVNYTEGQVTLDGNAIKSMGSAEVEAEHVLRTANGKAEMLLYPGAFLRLGSNSAVKMISPSLTDTRVELTRGEALVEVDQIEKENRLDVIDHGIDIRMEKKGIYSFRADQPLVAVYDGKAVVQQDDHSVDVGKGKELPLDAGAGVKPQKFDREAEDDLYAWSKLRADYMSEANMTSAQMVFVDNYPGWWYGTGWYWNQWFDTWAFVPGDGYLYSPFGFGFYSPAYWYSYAPRYYNPVHRGFGGYGGVRGGFAGRPAPAFRGPGAAMPSGGMRAPVGGGMRSGGRR